MTLAWGGVPEYAGEEEMPLFRVKMTLPSTGKFDPPLFWDVVIEAENRREAELSAFVKEPPGTKVIDSFRVEP